MSTQARVKINTSWRGIAAEPFRSLINLWSNRPGFDPHSAALVVLGHAALVYFGDHGNVLAWANQSQRLAIYAAGAGMMALIAGFTGTAIAQYGSSSGSVVSLLRSRYGQVVRRSWLGIVGWLLCSAVLCVAAMAVDKSDSPNGSEWIFEFALAIAIIKFARLLLLFDLILSAHDAGNIARPLAPKRNPVRQ